MAPSHRAGATPDTEGKIIRWARLYDLGTTILSFGRIAALRRRLVELAAIAPGERILDVGCGPGRLTILAGSVTGPSGEACGIDPSPEMIDLARRNAARGGGKVRFEVGAVERLPYPDDYFDVVLSSLMLHHLPDELRRRGLLEVGRVLKPGGRFVAVDFGATPGEGFGDHVLCVLGLRRGWHHAEHVHQMLCGLGFEAVDMGPTGHRGLAFVLGRKAAKQM